MRLLLFNLLVKNKVAATTELIPVPFTTFLLVCDGLFSTILIGNALVFKVDKLILNSTLELLF